MFIDMTGEFEALGKSLTEPIRIETNHVLVYSPNFVLGYQSCCICYVKRR